MWIVEVTGDAPPTGGNPPWKRLHRLKPETPESDVEAHLAELLGLHTAARATLGDVEILRTRRGRMVKRTFGAEGKAEP
jgi:hypothetical protein